MPTPSEELGQRIVERLVAEGLLTGDQKESILSGLASGSMKPEDWRLAIELSDMESEGNDE